MFGSEHRNWKSFFRMDSGVVLFKEIVFFLNLEYHFEIQIILKIIFNRNWPNYKTKNKSCLTQRENSQIPGYLFGLSTTFPPLSLFTPRNQDLVFCCQKEFPLWSKAAPSIFFFHRITMLHPRQSLQGRARAGWDEEGGEKAAQNVVLLEQTWRPATALGLATLTISSN